MRTDTLQKHREVTPLVPQTSVMPQSIVLVCLGSTLSLITLSSFAGWYHSDAAAQYAEAVSQRGYLFMDRKANDTNGNNWWEICISPVSISLAESGFPVSQTVLHLTKWPAFWQLFLQFKPSSKNQMPFENKVKNETFKGVMRLALIFLSAVQLNLK